MLGTDGDGRREHRITWNLYPTRISICSGASTRLHPSLLLSPSCFGWCLGGLGGAAHGSRGLGGSCSLRLGCFRLLLCRGAEQQGSRLTPLSLFSLTFFSALLLHPVVARPRLKERLVLPSRLTSLGPLWVVVTLPAGVYLYLLDRQYLSLVSPANKFSPRDHEGTYIKSLSFLLYRLYRVLRFRGWKGEGGGG